MFGLTRTQTVQERWSWPEVSDGRYHIEKIYMCKAFDRPKISQNDFHLCPTIATQYSNSYFICVHEKLIKKLTHVMVFLVQEIIFLHTVYGYLRFYPGIENLI